MKYIKDNVDNQLVRKKFKEYRLSANLTQAELSIVFNNSLTAKQISKIETGRIEINTNHLILYKKVFNCCYDDILNRRHKIKHYYLHN